MLFNNSVRTTALFAHINTNCILIGKAGGTYSYHLNLYGYNTGISLHRILEDFSLKIFVLLQHNSKMFLNYDRTLTGLEVHLYII
jgi:hypothetical protein